MCTNLSFKFENLKPQSSNTHVRVGNGRHYLKDTTVKFKRQVMAELMQHRAIINEFEREFDVYQHFLRCTITYYMPEKVLLTKKGYVSAKSMDVDNLNKVTIDAVFDSFNKLNDKTICQLHCAKAFSPDNNFHIKFELEHEDLNQLRGAVPKSSLT